MQESLVLGIDGGGTKTDVVLMDRQRQILGSGQAGSTNWNSVGLDGARTHLGQAIDAALADAVRDRSDVSTVCIGASGVDRPLDRERMTQWLGDLFPAARLIIHNDAVIALASGTGGEIYGIVLISGTGMIVYGFDRQGNRVRAGGWGALLGDAGSGYAIGAGVLKAVTWAADGRATETALTAAVLEHLGMEQPQQLIDWTYSSIAWERFAALAPLAMRCTEEGDAIADAIVEEAAKGLAVAVQAVVVRLHLTHEEFPLVLAGGNLRSGILQQRVRHHLQSVAPKAILIRPQVDPAVGAALLALNEA
jgi:N-acetylglucosamine kinase-like BadF-type ATPase